MFTHSTKICLGGAVVALACSLVAYAQEHQPFGPVDYNPDFQLFAPAELGSYGERPRPAEGYFFSYERLHWNVSGLKTPVGDPTPDPPTRAFNFFPGGPNPPPLVANSIATSVPRAKFGWGNRFDMGYVIDDQGWLVGVLDGPKHFQQQAIYGFDDPLDVTDSFGSVAIHFNDPTSQLSGFVDVIGNVVGGGVDPDGVGDGFADDVDGDGIHGPDGLDTDGDGVPDTIVGIPTDFDDLIAYPLYFETVTVRSQTRINGVELMRVHRLPALHRGPILELYYGARYLRIRDDFDVSALGGSTIPVGATSNEGTVLGLSAWDTRAENNIVGPQLGGRLLSKRGRWTVVAQGRFLAGFNIQNLRQVGNLGQLLVPGQTGGLQYTNSTSFNYGRRDEDFSPVGELRVETTFQVTRAIALKLGWTGLYMGDVARASKLVDYTFPNMGLLAKGQEDIFSNGVNFGVEINR